MVAAVDWQTLEAEADDMPTFNMLAYKGGPLNVKGFDFPVIVELSSASFEGTEQTYINRHHDQKRELGHTTKRKIDADGIWLEGVLSHENEDTRDIISASRRGKQFKASIEATFGKPGFVERGRQLRVNGQNVSGPAYVARNAVITGVALLTRAADMSSTVAIAAEGKAMNEDLRKFIEAAGFDADDMTEQQIAHFESQMVEPSEPSFSDFSDLRKQTREIAAAESERIADVRRICAEFNNPEVQIGNDSVVSLEVHAIKSNLSAKECKIEAMQWDLEQKCGGYSMAIHDSAKSDRDAEIIEASMLIYADGISMEDIEREKFFDEATIDAATSDRYRNYTVSRLAHDTMSAAGVYCPQGTLDDRYIEAAVRANNKLQAGSSGASTVSLPGILSNVANKVLLAAYRRNPSFIPHVFGRTSSRDFKPQYMYSLEPKGMLEELGPDGEIKHGELVESEYTLQVKTFAKMLTFTRTHLINDDLNSLTRTVSNLGIMSWKAREYAATQFIGGLQTAGFFDAGNGNLLTTNPLDIDGMTAGDVLFGQQTDPDGLPIAIMGQRLLAPWALKTITNQLANQTEIRDDTSGGKVFINNPWANTFSPFNSQWLDNVAANPDANRATSWYMFADPTITPAVMIGYLNGNENPSIASSDTTFNTLGMSYRAVHDWGLGQCDPKYAQKSVAV